ncbi:MAG TPA: DUF2249 domain-containing protein [Longimicrobiales bacterium]|nr:DUF2249 domain-containing protein [Longimicrobiales bacterium]
MSPAVRLDIRPVPPRDRYDRIMGEYERLQPGQTLELTVDHDPTCMYYTLKATRGDDAFAFDYLENGPSRWRVHVRKNADPEEE